MFSEVSRSVLDAAGMVGAGAFSAKGVHDMFCAEVHTAYTKPALSADTLKSILSSGLWPPNNRAVSSALIAVYSLTRYDDPP